MLIACIIFFTTFVLLVIDKIPRTVVAICGAAAMLVFGVLDVTEALRYVSWQTIGLLLGMFFLVAVLSEAGFFQSLALYVARLLNYEATGIFVTFPILAAVLAAFIDSITVMIFLASLSYEICQVVRMDPVPLIIAEVCLANIGGSATLVGDPPNVILGTMLGFTFNDFCTHTGPIAVIGAIICIAIFYWRERRIICNQYYVTPLKVKIMHTKSKIQDGTLLVLGLLGFGTAICLLIMHPFIVQWTGIRMTVAHASLMPAMLVLLLGGRKTYDIIHKLDIEVLVFFIALFILVGGLEKTQVIKALAVGMVNLSGGNPMVLLGLLLFGTGYTSGVVDNVPLALTMGVILQDIAQSDGAALPIMIWALSLGVDIGGNCTPIGASANVVAYTNMERYGSKVSWRRWLGLALFPTTVVLMISYLLILVKLHVGWY